MRGSRKILTNAFQRGWEIGVDIYLKEWGLGGFDR